MSIFGADTNADWPYFQEFIVLAEYEEATGVILLALPVALRINIDITVFAAHDAITVHVAYDRSRI